MKKFSQEEFIQRCIDKFGNKFDYSLVVYKNFKTPVKIICPIHGIFEISPDSFLGSTKYGCPQYGIEAKTGKISKEEFLKRAHEKFGDKYDFSKMIYINFKTDIEIICPIHGSFWMTP